MHKQKTNMAAKKNGQRLAGTSRKPGSKVSTRLTLAAKIMIFAAVFTGHFLTTSLNQKKMVTFFKKLLLSITICFSFMMANSQVPTLNGAITSNLTAPLYYVTGDIYISSGVSITISAGTTLEFQDGLMFTINGTLTAVGSSGSEITFTASNPGTGWFGIELTSTSSSTFTYCIIEYVIKNQQPCNSNFSSCGGVYQSSATASFTNCTFRDNEVCSGGGVYVVSSLAQIYDCTFHNNVAEEYGGAIYINNASQNSNIQLNTIENNTAEQGGGMYFTSCDYEIVVDQNDLNYNEAEYGAGAYFNEIDISGESPFADNTVYDNTASVDGGGLYFNSCIIQKIEDNTLELNEADDGGGIYVNESKINIMILNLLENNSADNDGGGIFLNESYIRFRLSKLIGNSASNNGGAICISGEYISGDPNFIVNSLLADNDAGSNGGGIYTDEQFISYSNTIADNSATNGGGIYNYLATPTVINTIIWGNTATNYNPQASPTPSGTNGYSYTCCRSITNCATCTTNDPNFVGSGNYALDRASSCYNTGYNSAYHESIDLDGNTRVFHNTIDIGAYEDPFKYICGQLSTETWTDHNPKGIDYKVYCDLVVPAGSTLTVNSGATIAFDDGLKLEVNGSVDANGTVNDSVTFTALDQNDGWGGIIYNGTGSQYSSDFDYCIFEYGKKTKDCGCDIFTSVYNGGAFFIRDFGNIDISNSTFRHNIASRGGAIYIRSTTNDIISPVIGQDNTFTYNDACKGGAICMQGDDSETYTYRLQADILGNTFSYNSVTGISTNTLVGGAIFTDIYDNSEISGNTFYENDADIDNSNSKGGAVFLCGGSINLFSNNTLYNNKSWTGGALCVNYGNHYQGTDPEIEGNTIYSNDAVNGGGVAFIKGSQQASNNTEFYSNKVYNNDATRDGGGIYISGFSPTIYNCLISGNTSLDDGGGIYDTMSLTKYYNCTIAGNSADEGGGYFCPNTSSTPTFINDIIYFNSPSPYNNDFSYNGSGANYQDGFYSNCDIPLNSWSSFGGSPNITGNPQFVDHNNGDYRISYDNSSPCIEGGNNNVPYYAVEDLKNDSRIIPSIGSGGKIDIGAYEYEYPTPSYKFAQNDSSIIDIDNIEGFVYPNPVISSFMLNLNVDTEETINIQLINSVGKLVNEINYNLKEGENQLSFNREDLNTGIYFLKLDANTISSKTFKLIFK